MANISAPTEAVRLEIQNALNYFIRKKNNEQIKEVLNEPSIDINYQNVDGDTALHLALDTENDDIAEELVDRDAKGDIENNRHKTSISILGEKLQSISSSSKRDKWNSMRKKLKRRATEPCQDEPCSSRPRLNDTLGTTTHDTSSVEKPKTVPSAGFKTSLHGIMFQLRLSMLCAVRAYDEGLKSFEMASEMVAAEKFDDIVFQYDIRELPISVTKTKSWRFLQAKHKLEPDLPKNRITHGKLLSISDKEDFSLQKYFISFCKIKNNELFKENNATLNDFVIITNTTQNVSDKWKELFDDQKDFVKDNMLYFEGSVKYKLNVSSEIREKMKMNLIKTALELKTLKKKENNTDLEKRMNLLLNAIKIVFSKTSITNAIHMADMEKTTIKGTGSACQKILKILKKFFKDPKEASWKEEYDILKDLEQQLRKKDKRLQPLPVIMNNIKNKVQILSKNILSKLQNSEELLNGYNAEMLEFERELKEFKDIILKSEDIELIKKQCETLFAKKYLTKNFNSVIQKKTDSDLMDAKEKIGKIIEEKLENLTWKISIIQIASDNQNIDELFTEFFNKFYIITNYPDEEKLGGYIDGEFCELLNLLESKLVGAAFERRMMEFLKFYKNGMAEYFTHGNMEKFMNSLKRELRGQYAIGINALYVKGLNDYRIRFKNNSEQMKTFIDPIKDQTQIYHLKTTNLQSSAAKIQHIIEESSHYNQNDSYVTHLIKLFDEQQFGFQAFEMEKSHLLLVITCNEADDNKRKSFNELSERLLNIFERKSSIKLILISPDDFSIDMAEFFKGLNIMYPFKRNSEQLETFIDPTKDQRQTYHFRTTTLRLSAIKVLHTAQTSDQYRHDNSYIFTDLNALLTEDKEPNDKCLLPQEIVLEAFQMEKSHSLLVIECNMNEDDVQRVDYNEFFKRLKEILTNNSRKKLILISNDLSFGQLKAQGNHEDEIYFRDLEEVSQTRVIEEQVLFQGATNESKVQLKELIDETSADRIFNQEILSEFLEIMMSREIKKKNIKIGNDKAFSSIDYTKDSYISRHFRNEQIERDEEYFCTAESLAQKVVIVANEAGMGKSTVLTSLANQMKKSQEHLWIVKINLPDHSGSRRQPSLYDIKYDKNTNTMDTDEAIEFVSKMVVSNRTRKSSIRSMESNLFKMGLTDDTENEGDDGVSNQTNQQKLKKPKIVIMFDGFDEVSRKHGNSTTVLIKALKSSQVLQIWISTRKLEMTDLEKELNTCAHSLVPLEPKEQKKLASILWKKKLKFKKSSTEKKLVNKKIDEIWVYLKNINLPSEDYTKRLKSGISDIAERDSKDWSRDDLTVAINQLDFTEYTEELIKRLEPVEITDVDFTTNPLHLTMLTEVIFDDKFLLPEMNGIFDLFKKFVDMKFSIYCERANLDDSDMAEDVHDMLSDDSLWKIHRTLAAKEFDIHNIIPNLQSKCDKIMSSKGKIKLSRIGFLELDEYENEKEKVSMVFTHRSYAEFFCSIYLIKKLEKPEAQELTRDLFGPTKADKYALMHRFFNENPDKKELKDRVRHVLDPKSTH